MCVTEGPAGTLIITGAEGWAKPMRLVLTTRHRRVVIATGDDVTMEDGDATFVSNTEASLDLAPGDDYEVEEHFGFRPTGQEASGEEPPGNPRPTR